MDYKVGITERIRQADYLTVAQLFLKDNFRLERSLEFNDIKPRLLGHWGTCHGINLAYANLEYFYRNNRNYSFVLGPGHGFPALNANLFLDGKLTSVTVEELCKKFSWPEGFPSHASPSAPGVIVEGGELGYALGAAYGAVLGHPEKTVAVLIGDGEMETATTLASMNLAKIVKSPENGRVLPILHLNGYKISGPTIYGRKSERELNELIRGFGYVPVWVASEDPETWQSALDKATEQDAPFIIMETEKGAGGPTEMGGEKIAGNFLAHQIPLKNAKTDEKQLKTLENWLKSYDWRPE